MSVTIEVFRMEHAACQASVGLPHGPHTGSMCPESWVDAPQYGGAGRAPVEIARHQRCGVTRQQLDQWWATAAEVGHTVSAYAKGWRMARYEVPVESAWIDRGQVVFDEDSATRVGELTLDETLDSLDRSKHEPRSDYHRRAAVEPRQHCAAMM